MKVLAVNVIGIPSGSSSNLIEARVFQDYDAVVVNPENLDTLYGHGRIEYGNRENGILTAESWDKLLEINKKRREQVNGLLQRGGVVVCFLESLREYRYRRRHQGKDYWCHKTNYNWLMESGDVDRELGEIIYSKGNTIDYIDSGHPFSEYLMTKPSWSAYISIDNCKNWKILASAYGTHAVALTKRVGLGHIVLLPSYYDHHNGELLERCIKKLLKSKEVTSQPGWSKAVLVPGQEALISRIELVTEQINALEKERENLEDDNAKLERWKCLLYAKGKHELEPVVREALASIGFDVKSQPDKDSDGLAVCDDKPALLEVVGSKNTIKIEKLGELTKNMGNFMAQHKKSVKGILIGNPFCEEPLDNRPPKGSQKLLFAKELVESAEQQNVAVLLTTDLYEVVTMDLTNQLSEVDKRNIKDCIINGRGLVRISY